MPSGGCSRPTVGTRGPPASPSATPTRATARGASRRSEKPPAAGDRGLALAGVGQDHFGGRILNIPVPHTGQTPFMAGRPFAIFTCWGFEIFRLALHFTQ